MTTINKSDAVQALQDAGNLDALYRAIAPLNMTPGWIEREKPLLRPEPDTGFLPTHWRYSDCKAALDAASRLINTDLAERRNMVLRNPAEGNDYATTKTQVNAYQTILPGEEARSHRHTPHALRVIIEAEGSFSVVNGDKHPMETGDIVLTPGWSWHGHGHDGDAPAYWLDGLDVPLTALLEPMFFEPHPDGYAKVDRVTPDSPYRFTWETIQARLDGASPDDEGYFGRRIGLEADEMPTIAITVERLEAGQATRRYRHSANTVFSPMMGAGTSLIGDHEFSWGRGDCVAAPIWHWIEHRAEEDTVLFSMSDENLMRYANYYRFEGAE
ncbi:MAG: cupin domain-containing protein [Rhodospirillaceae bacterium]|jgi:gentisate 1,2-dioxygenase|nr:cupin domain-containing protein [Rhodospirillaceae bacterium]MBT4673941.1 cupin domain-containing protein [Rhodospirillaceae bacterium]MBT4720310.1 cupin domain-containing protein [Rhodospirillaceae bacterium]MBT5178080.1 cupin domain-containing protein [Rhodospirillaceae bacterium]MBT5840817.1 cupin domain-containing protein [Rhodospirillaceae bacterium]